MNQYIIKCSATILTALKAIDKLSSKGLTIFVVDEDNRLIGSLTDGDIRRHILSHGTLEDSVVNAMNKTPMYLTLGDEQNVNKFKKCKSLGLKIIPIINNNKQIIDVISTKDQLSILPIDAVLMAGGKGERLRPLTEKKPKPLLPVGDKAIIDHNVDRLISYGIRNISVTVNYLGEQIEEHYKEPHSDVDINCVREPIFMGTIGAVKLVKKFVNDTILVMNSDLFTDINYEDFYLHFVQYDADMSVAAVPYSINIPYGILDIENFRNIKGVIEKPTYDYYANAGIYLFKKSILELIPNGVFFNATDLIELLISKNKKVIRFPINGTWIDIGNPYEYQKANDIVKHMNI